MTFLMRFAGMLSGMVFIALFSRYVGVENFGRYAYALAIAGLLSGLMVFGLEGFAVRELSQFPEDKARIIGQGLYIQLALALLSFAGLVVYWGLIRPDLDMLVIVAIVVTYVFLDKLGLLVSTLFIAREQMEYKAGTVAVGSAIMLVLAGAGLFLRLSMNWILVLVGISYACQFALILYLARHRCGLSGLAGELRPSWSLVRKAAPFFSVSLGYIVIVSYPRLILGAFGSLAAVGLYAAAERICMIILGFGQILDVVIYPIFAKKAQRSLTEIAQSYQQVSDMLMVGGLLLGLGIASLLPEILWLLFGPKYHAALPVLSCLLPSIIIMLSGARQRPGHVCSAAGEIVLIDLGTYR